MINHNLQDLLAKAKKKYGEDVVADYTKKFECLQLPSLSINAALGGGIPKGCITEIYGWESAGKTTIALYAAAAAQEEGKIVVYVDVECAIDFDRAKLLGVDISPEKFIVLRPTTAEEALGLVKQFVTCDDGSIGLIVLDSVAAMVAQCVVDGEVGEAKMGVIARMMSQTVPTWIKPAEKNNIPIIAINQLREKIGVMFGSPETTNGGNALKFYSSVRVNVSKSGKIEENGERVGHIMKIRIDKNKVAIPSKRAEVNFNYKTGIDLMAELIDLAEDLELVDKKGGGHYSYNGTKIGQGMPKAKLFLEDNPDILEEIQNKVIKSLNS